MQCLCGSMVAFEVDCPPDKTIRFCHECGEYSEWPPYPPNVVPTGCPDDDEEEEDEEDGDE